ncbi:MAG: hypothetical protein ACM3U1_12120 [Chloroflexota bacterium]
MKKYLVAFFAIWISFALFNLSSLKAQYFNKYYTWASEKHMWPGNDIN